MDSGNSESMQSSSGGDDEEYDSRPELISAFFDHSTISTNPPPPQPPPPPPLLYHHYNASTSFVFDPLSKFFNHSNDLESLWPSTSRSDLDCTEITSSFTPNFSTSPLPTALHFPPMVDTETTGGSTSTSTVQVQQTHVVRKPRKRSRASRRAPTTVLTTDTTNFRSMVQEFTGIPTTPFASSPFSRTKLDLFGASPTIRSSLPFDLRPFAQKIQLPNSTSLSSPFLTTPPSVSNSGSVNYQGLINSQNDPLLTFHTLLQSDPKYPISNQGNLDSKSSPQGSLIEFGLNHHDHHNQLSALPNLVSTDGNLDILESVTNGKLDHSASSSSNFHGDKGSQIVPSSGEGTGVMEPWLCTSDR